MRKTTLTLLLLALSCLAVAADFAPTLQWVKAGGGSGLNTVAGAAVDQNGNLYIVGSTTSLDFPVTLPAQHNAGGSVLTSVNTATGSVQKLYPPGISSINTIAADPENPKTLYAGAGNAIRKSSDGGATWTELYQFGAGSIVPTIAVDPSNGSTVYAGIGPANPFGSGAPQGGAFKSLDGGVTWSAIDNGVKTGSISTTAANIWVDPANPQVLFANFVVTAISNTSYAFMRSGDGGGSWTSMGSFAAAVAFDPFAPSVVYAVFGSGIVESSDYGQTFAPLAQLANAPASLIADPQHAGVLYAGSYGGVYRSTDSGATWSQVSKAALPILAADPANPVFYGASASTAPVKTTDGFATASPVDSAETSPKQLLAAGQTLWIVAAPTTDVFVVKLDNSGNTVYSTYLGGSQNDTATALALAADGSLYVTGTTASADFPASMGAFASAAPQQPPGTTLPQSSFLFMLNPDGSLGWSTYFGVSGTNANSLAVDAAGNPYIGGSTTGHLPVTQGAYQTQFQQSSFCTGIIGCFPGPTSAFVTKFNSKGSSLLYSTYVPTDLEKKTVQGAQAMVVDSAGNVWFGGSGNVVELNADGSALIASANQADIAIRALALDTASNVYVTGNTDGRFSGTAGAFQQGLVPAVPALPTQISSGQICFVAKWNSGLTQMTAATLLGGLPAGVGESIAVDGGGDVIVSGSVDGNSFPTHAPFQTSFSPRSGFVAALDASLSALEMSTYVGDVRPFDAHAAVPDGQGNILLTGTTLDDGGPFEAGDNGAAYSSGGLLVVNKIALQPGAGVRLDSVQNYASGIANPIAPGETIAATGAGFGADARIVLDGVPLATISSTAGSVVATVPDDAKTSGAFTVQVASGGAVSNSVYVPAASASAAIYSVDGSGVGQGYILNSDGTLNSPTNPAATGSAITIVANGAGAFTTSGGYAVTSAAPSVYVDGFYANGIAATIGPMAGLPGEVYMLSVYVPDPAQYAASNPNLTGFKFPAQVGIQLVMGSVNPYNPENSAMISQNGVILNVK